MTVLTWPSIGAYSTAVQLPDRVFSVPEIAAATFATRPPLHLPVAASGANAVVFRADVNGKTTAVRCFTREPGHERTRYLAFADHVAQAGLDALTPPRWHDNAMYVADAWRPVVTMPWISGQPLHRYVEDRLHDPATLTDLANRWVELLGDLTVARVAHGDLQHGNVLVTPEGLLRLIDFDGVWVPSIADVNPTEWGHPNYQHPERGEQGTWGPHIDWFAGLVVDVSLRALAADPSLWERHNEENLIFIEDDFRGSTEIWDQLAGSHDVVVRERSRLLANACAEPADLQIDLLTLLTSGLPQRPNADVIAGVPSGESSSTQTGSSPSANWWVDAHSGDQQSVEPPSVAAATTTPPIETSASFTAGENTTPPERRRAQQQEANSDWGANSQLSTPTSGQPAAHGPRTTPPPPTPGQQPLLGPRSAPSSLPVPGATALGGATPSSGRRSWSFAATMLAAVAAVIAASTAIEEPQVRDLVLGVVIAIVLVDLVRVTRT